MIRICPTCNTANDPSYTYCKICGTQIDQLPLTEDQAPPPTQMMAPPMAYPAVVYPKKEYQWGDICTVAGFILSILGVFVFTPILLPLALILTIVGFCQDKTRKLAVTGMILSLVGICVKIGIILYEQAMVPDWLVSGIFR